MLEENAKEVNVEEEDEIDAIHTACKECVFNESVFINERRTQVGCKVGQLDFYREKGIQVVEAEDVKEDFYVINGRICSKRRVGKWKYSKEPLAKQIEEINKEIIPGFDIVVYIDNTKTIDDLTTTLNSINELNYPTGLNKLNVVIVNNFSGIKTSEIISLLNGLMEVSWVVEEITEKNSDIYRCIDISYKKYKKQFYSVFLAGYKIYPDFFHNIDRAINEELIQCCVVRPDEEINGLTVLNNLHSMLVGNRNGSIIEKIEELELADKGVFKRRELCLN